jgi:hypothetical protein
MDEEFHNGCKEVDGAKFLDVNLKLSGLPYRNTVIYQWWYKVSRTKNLP